MGRIRGCGEYVEINVGKIGKMDFEESDFYYIIEFCLYFLLEIFNGIEGNMVFV